MMAMNRLTASAVVVCLGLGAARAEEPVQFSDKPASPVGGMSEKVIGGTRVEPNDWPATFYQVVSEKNLNRVCTATLIGPQTVLLAAHCLGGSSEAAFKLRGDVTKAKCAEHPDYKKSITPENAGCTGFDIALCRLDKAITVAGPYETINTDVGRATPDTDVWLLGYGCVKRSDYTDSSNPPMNPILYAALTKLGRPLAEDPDYIQSLGENVVICQGDSGGAVYAGDAGINTITEPRSIVAVNSCNTAVRDRSFFVDTSAERPRAFILSWSKGKEVCGVTLKADDGRCRQP